MASGKSITLKALDNLRLFRKVEPREQRERDRSLAGKARIRARRAARKEA